MQEKIKDPDFWNSLWQVNLGQHMGEDPAKRWNKKAQSFNKVADSREGMKRVQAVLYFLHNHSALWQGMKVLDIGCGPGNFSLPLAQMGAQVTALDPAEKMLEILQKEIETKKFKNINVVQGLWEELDIEEMGWVKEFDLVFASQSPGLRDKETLQKIIDCSKKYCFASGFDGKRKMTLYDSFWLKYFNKPYMKNSHDIIYLINLLYTMGYRPSLEFLDLSREEVYSPEEGINKLQEVLAESESQLENGEQKIKEFINENNKNGVVKQYVRHVMGLLLWQVD